jgi:hypothetical protein
MMGILLIIIQRDKVESGFYAELMGRGKRQVIVFTIGLPSGRGT